MNSNTAIAVVGLGCILPDATSPSATWNNFVRGHSALRPLTQRTYDWSCYKRESDRARGVFEAPIGAEIGSLSFDWRKFRMAPLDAQAINPMHLHVLEAGVQAIEEVKHIPHETTGVFVGGTGLGWQRDSAMQIRLPEFLDAAARACIAAGVAEQICQELLESIRKSFQEQLRPVSDDGVVNSLGSIAAGRLALRFDLRGPHAGIDAGFASGLAAIGEAVRLLRDGTVDLAVAGGASECISPLDLLAFHELAVLAPSQVRPFDVAAEGTLLGEGAALFAMKRLDDAIQHGERIYALIQGIGYSSDGRSRSLLSPSVEGQSLAMQRAYTDADFDPATVGYIECHATGTPVGDASEIHALATVFKQVGGHDIAIGSAKPFVGHLRGASGAVGFLRAVLALHHGIVPAQIGFEQPHPNLELDSTPFFVPTRQLPLVSRPGATCARAAVSSFGLGGNNYHAVLEAWNAGAQRAATVRRPRASSEPIAIVGLGGVLPDADGVLAFWKSLIDGKDAAREVPTARWPIDQYYDPDQNRTETTYTRIGCFVEPIPEPSASFRVPPAVRVHIDPSQMLAFRAAEEAVADARLEQGTWDRSRTAVILGFIGCQGRRLLAEARLNFREFECDLERALISRGIPAEKISAMLLETERIVLAALPSITEDTLPGYLGSFNAARIARRFDLHGPHLVVDSACASSLAALHTAVRLLRQGGTDTVILGGVWADSQPEFFVQNCRFSALSASAITPFDERANGFVPGEGAAVLVLRRLADAERDGQRVHALVRSIEGSTDGATGRSIYSPSVDGESLSMQRALQAADVAPDQVDYVECHGTGTALGDLTEIQACTRAYGSGRSQPLLVGSVKSNIGHLMAGAGAVALLKTTLAIREGTIPASIKVQKLNPKIDFTSGPVEVVTAARRWETQAGRPRRAGVSGFGLGGTNFHSILEEYRPPMPVHGTSSGGLSGGDRKSRILPIAVARGQNLSACAGSLKVLASNLEQSGIDRFWSSVAASQQHANGSDAYRVAIVASEPGVLAQRVKLLDSAIASGHDLSFLRHQGIFVASADATQKAAAVFPGQGPQYPNMLRDAAAAFPELSLTLDRLDRAYEAICGRRLRPAFFTEDAQGYLQSDEDIHCAVFAVNVALFSLFESYGARIDAVMGQSAGELSALVAARSISLEDGLRAVRERTLAVLGITTADPGRMITLTCGAERAEQLMRDLPGYAALAADNGPSASIVSGDRAAVEALLGRAADQGIEAKVLAVSHGYHSQLIAAARPRYRAALDSIAFKRPELKFYSSITGDAIHELPLSDYPAHLESQFVEPVRLRQAVTALHRDQIRLFVECGPKWPLSTFISEILAGKPHVAQATIHPKVGEVEQLHRAFACLYVHRICTLGRSRKMPMSASSITPSVESAAQSRNSTAVPRAAGETQLLAALRSIRDVVESALRPYDTADTVDATAHHEPVEAAPPPLTAEPVSAPVTRTNSGAAPRSDLDDVRKRVHASLITELVKRTGYPEEMLEPDLDLEAELGIDTVKQVSSLAAVREQYGLQADPKFRMQDARTLRQAVDYLVARIATSHQPSPPAAAVTESASLQPVIVTEPAQSAAADPGNPSRPTVPTPEGSPADLRQSMHSMLVAELVKRTGYPEEMIEPDMDLEAELGIDTVKQVAALAAVREHEGLEPDPKFRMQDARTLQQAVDYLVGRISRAREHLSPPPPPAVGVSTFTEPPRTAIPDCPASIRTAYPVVSTCPAIPPPRMDTVAPVLTPTPATSVTKVAQPATPQTQSSVPDISSAINSIQQSLKSLTNFLTQGMRGEPKDFHTQPAHSSKVTESVPSRGPRSAYPDVLLESLIPQVSCAWQKDEALEVTGLAVADAFSILPSITVHNADLQPLHVRDADAQIVANSRLVHMGRATSSAPPGMLDAVREGRTASNDSMLREYLDRCGRTNRSVTEWAHSQGFTLAVGGAHVPNDDVGPSRAMLSLLGCAYDVASFAWFGLTGAVHSLSAIERLCFHRVPRPGDEMLICARTAHPDSGFWRADVAVFDTSGELFAEVSGIEGTPIQFDGPSSGGSSTDPADRAWRRFARRLGRDSGVGGDITS